jgi:hypothetical protein
MCHPQSAQQQQNQQSCIVTPRHAVKWKREQSTPYE